MTATLDRKELYAIIYNEALGLMAPVRNPNENRGVLL